MPLRYFLAYIVFIFAPPIILFVVTAFALIAAPVYASIIAYELSKRSCCACCICILPLFIVLMYGGIALCLFISPALIILYYLLLIIVSLLIIFE